jgi:hypothetical protein
LTCFWRSCSFSPGFRRSERIAEVGSLTWICQPLLNPTEKNGSVSESNLRGFPLRKRISRFKRRRKRRRKRRILSSIPISRRSSMRGRVYRNL